MSDAQDGYTPDGGRLFPTGKRRFVVEFDESDHDLLVRFMEFLRDEDLAATVQREYRHWGRP